MFFIYLNIRYYPIESVKNCRVSATPNTHVYKLILKITAILSLSLRALTRGSAHSTDPKKYILSPDRTMFLLASRLRRTRHAKSRSSLTLYLALKAVWKNWNLGWVHMTSCHTPPDCASWLYKRNLDHVQILHIVQYSTWSVTYIYEHIGLPDWQWLHKKYLSYLNYLLTTHTPLYIGYDWVNVFFCMFRDFLVALE